MSRIVKIVAALAMLAGLSACTVVPAQVGYYSGRSVGVAVVRPAAY